MIDHIISKEIVERAVLVGLITPRQDEAKATEYLAELAFLADTAGAETVQTFLQRLDYPNPRTYVGKGKLEEIRDFVENNDIGMVIFSTSISCRALPVCGPTSNVSEAVSACVARVKRRLRPTAV